MLPFSSYLTKLFVQNVSFYETPLTFIYYSYIIYAVNLEVGKRI